MVATAFCCPQTSLHIHADMPDLTPVPANARLPLEWSPGWLWVASTGDSKPFGAIWPSNLPALPPLWQRRGLDRSPIQMDGSSPLQSRHRGTTYRHQTLLPPLSSSAWTAPALYLARRLAGRRPTMELCWARLYPAPTSASCSDGAEIHMQLILTVQKERPGTEKTTRAK